MASENKGKKVAIVGSGLVGKSWAMIFASVGYNVTMFDIEPAQVAKALANIGDELDQFEKDGVLRGTLKAAEQKPLITGSSDLAECVKVSSELIKRDIISTHIFFFIRMLYTFKNVFLRSWT